MKAVFFLAVSCVLLAGCAGDPWVHYETSVYRSLRESNKEAFDAHTELLEAMIQYAENKGRHPRPGIYAECACYAARQGRGEEAMRLLEREKQAYPESTRFVDLVGRLFAGEERLITPSREEKKK